MKNTIELSARQMKDVKGGRIVSISSVVLGDQRRVCRDDEGGLQMTVPCETDADCVYYWGEGSKCEDFNS